MWPNIIDFSQIIIADIILSGDNALVIGMAAAGLSPQLRKRAILFGMVIAAILRIVFSVAATKMLGIPGILFVGACLLFWVCWRLYQDLREGTEEHAVDALQLAESEVEGYTGPPRRSMMSALLSITIADVSMSLDNVLAVAAIADGDTQKLVFGLGLAIVLMACAATLIMKLLTKFPWISWLGLAVLLYVAGEMMYRGLPDPSNGIFKLMGMA